MDSKGSFEPDEALALFGVKNFTDDSGKEFGIPRRGRYYCSHKGDNCNQDGDGGTKRRGSGCTFNVAFSYFKKTGSYHISDNKDAVNASYPTNLCLAHSHDTVDVGIDGYILVKKQKDMSSAEVEYVQGMALLGSRMPKIQHAMSVKFRKKNRTYDSQMLHRIVKNEKDSVFGPNRHRIPELMAMGSEVRSKGGHWEVELSDTMKLEGTRLQTALQKQYALQYGSYFVTVDGTYGTNKYGLTALPWITADCLGLSQLCGMTTSLSENSKDVISSGRLFMIASVPDDESADPSVVSYSWQYLPVKPLESNLMVLSISRQAPLTVEGVVILNRVAINSCRGTIYTDQGARKRKMFHTCTGLQHADQTGCK